MSSEESTRELIAKARAGGHEAFDALAREHRGRVLTFIRTRLGAGLRHETDPGDVQRLEVALAVGYGEPRAPRALSGRKRTAWR